MTFQGADVSGLDRTANRCLEGAEFAENLARALEALAAALEAMSWTGWAAAFAAYLRSVVIPWVKYIGQCLKMFGSLLQLASTKQKGASEDAPPVTIPATAWNPPPTPAPVGIEPPQLSDPSRPISRTDDGGTGTGGGSSVAPGSTIGRTDAGGTGTGGGSVTTVTGITPDGDIWTATTVTGGTPRVATPSYLPGSTSPSDLGRGLGAAAPSIPDVPIDTCFGDGAVGSGGVGSGSGSHGPTGSGGSSGSGGPSGSGGSGPSSGTIGSGGGSGPGAGTSGGSAESSPLAQGDPAVQSSPVQASTSVLGSTGGTGSGTSSMTTVTPIADGGAMPALAAAPLGLAGVGAAALAALRAKGVQPDAGEDDQPL